MFVSIDNNQYLYIIYKWGAQMYNGYYMEQYIEKMPKKENIYQREIKGKREKKGEKERVKQYLQFHLPLFKLTFL